MEECNKLGLLATHIDNLVAEELHKGSNMCELSQLVTTLMSRHYARWNWVVLCGDNYNVSVDGRRKQDVMLCRRYANRQCLIVLRGSPLDAYREGPAVLSVLRNKLEGGGSVDADAIKKIVEESRGEPRHLAELVQAYFKERYPDDMWTILVGDDFALSQQADRLPLLTFCANVGHLNISVFKTQALGS